MPSEKPKPGTQQHAVWMATNRKVFRSCSEIAGITGLAVNAVSRRLSELCKDQRLLESSPKKCRISGRSVKGYRRR